MERAELARLLAPWQTGGPGKKESRRAIVAERAATSFMSSFAAAVAGDTEVFLTDPAWTPAERATLDALLAAAPPSPTGSGRGWLMIPSGGSSGTLKFARHDQATLAAAVSGFCAHFGVQRVNAVSVLPLHHVSGLMAWMRSAMTGGDFRPLDWKAVQDGAYPALPEAADGWVISLVPTQLERLLREPAAVGWLGGFRAIFLGGGPAWPGLLERAAQARLPLSPGYGMTESAAMATALRPQEFLAGARDSGRALPHITVRVEADGVVILAGDSLCRGYFPEWVEARSFATSDVGQLDAAGHLTILGRADQVIITGGEKVQPAEVEEVLRGTGEFESVVVLGLPDGQWGQEVVAVFPGGAKPDLARVERAVAARLAAPKRPKRYLALPTWPVSEAGKLKRGEVARLAAEAATRGGR